MSKIQVNATYWATALSKLPFKELEDLVEDMENTIGTVQSLHQDSEAMYELYDILHEAIKWFNDKKTSRNKVQELAHRLNLTYMYWHPEKREAYLSWHPKLTKKKLEKELKNWANRKR